MAKPKPKPHDALWLLRRVRRVLGYPHRFCQGAYAKNADGWAVPTDHPSATQWCLVGGILRGESGGAKDVFALRGGKGTAAQYDALDALHACIPKSFKARPSKGRVSAYSDEKGHAAVVKLLDKAIARLEKDQP